MASCDLTKLPPRHAAVNYFELRSYANKIQRTASDIGLMHKSLHRNILLTFGKV